MNIPILLNHDRSKLIGKTSDDGTIEMIDGRELTMAQLFDTFGNIGVEIIEFVAKGPIDTKEQQAENLRVKKFRILEWSFEPKPAMRVHVCGNIPEDKAVLKDDRGNVLGMVTGLKGSR